MIFCIEWSISADYNCEYVPSFDPTADGLFAERGEAAIA
jgi:hypothetical protein